MSTVNFGLSHHLPVFNKTDKLIKVVITPYKGLILTDVCYDFALTVFIAEGITTIAEKTTTTANGLLNFIPFSYL